MHCLKDQIEAAPCAAYLSSQGLETAQLRSYKNWITCHLHICTRTRGWGLVRQRERNLTGLVQPGPVHFKGKDDSCVVKGALHSSFGLFWKIKQAETDPTPLQYRTTYPYLNASINYRFNYQSQFTKIEHFKFKTVSPQDQGLLSNNIKWIQLICLQLPFWKMQVTSVLYISPSFIHTWKKHKKASPTQPQKNKCIPTVFNHTKLCIYYAIRKSFTDSWLTVLPKQDIVTNCKGIAMRHLARQWKLKHMTLQMTLRDALMRKESCTYNELEFLMVLDLKAHRTHHTEKCKGKGLSQQQPPLPQWK